MLPKMASVSYIHPTLKLMAKSSFVDFLGTKVDAFDLVKSYITKYIIMFYYYLFSYSGMYDCIEILIFQMLQIAEKKNLDITSKFSLNIRNYMIAFKVVFS